MTGSVPHDTARKSAAVDAPRGVRKPSCDRCGWGAGLQLSRKLRQRQILAINSARKVNVQHVLLARSGLADVAMTWVRDQQERGSVGAASLRYRDTTERRPLQSGRRIRSRRETKFP
jgi:hypothetical protein